MKIKKINIENFRSIKKLSIEFPNEDILTLVGANNAGKSNILRAINNLLGERWFKGDTAELNDFYNRNKDNKIKIEIIFDDNKKVIFSSSQDWPEYLDQNGEKIYGSRGNVKEDFPCTYLEANRSIDKAMQFKSWELMGKIAKSFNDKAKSKSEVIEKKFDEIMEIFNEIPEFKKFKKDFIDYFEELQADTPYKLKVDFKAFSPLNYFKSINILANDSSINDKYDTNLIELGDGSRNLVLFALVRSYAKNFKNEAQGVLAIEEPEIYLHPQAQKHLYSIFREIVKESNIQIIFTSHSPYFVNSEEFHHIGLVSKSKDDGTTVKMLTKEKLVDFCKNSGVPSEKTNVGNINEFYATTSNFRLNEAFFSKFTILVEGDTEELALPIYLSKIGINCDTCGISIIAVNGKNQIPKYWRLFHSFNIPLLIMFDNDNSTDKIKSNTNISNCFNISVDDILKDCDVCKVISANKSTDEVNFNQKIIVIESNFESSLKKDLEKYCEEKGLVCKFDSFESEAKRIIKPLPQSQKGQIARYIARKIIIEYPDFVPAIIGKIKENIPNTT